MSQTVDLILACLGIATAVCVAIGVVVRLMLLPWLLAEIAEPVKETNKQVTLNGHTSNDPTLLDKIDKLSRASEEARVAALAAGNLIVGHLDRSADEWGRIWDAIKANECKGHHHHD